LKRRFFWSLVVIASIALLFGLLTNSIHFTSNIIPPTQYPLKGTVHITIGSNTPYGTADLSIADNGNDHLVVTLDPRTVVGADLNQSEDVSLDSGSIPIGTYSFGSGAMQELTILVNKQGFEGKGYHIAAKGA